jgi:uncharacterized protein YndB with AHSA1/START domain
VISDAPSVVPAGTGLGDAGRGGRSAGRGEAADRDAQPGRRELGGGGEYQELTPRARLVFTWAWDQPAIGAGIQLIEVDFIAQADGSTTVVMTNRGLTSERVGHSHRDGWEGSFDNLARLLSQ